MVCVCEGEGEEEGEVVVVGEEETMVLYGVGGVLICFTRK